MTPKDRELDIVGMSFSPGVRRVMGQVGGKEAFEGGGTCRCWPAWGLPPRPWRARQTTWGQSGRMISGPSDLSRARGLCLTFQIDS